MESCGWFLSRTKEVDDKGKKWKILSFDPIFQDDVSYEARTEKVLYHWTPEYRYESIKEEGLFPRSENNMFKYPNRLHLAKGSLSDGQILNLGRQLYDVNKERANNGRYVLLKIDVSRLPMSIEFYYDPRYDSGFYVKDPIPSYAIVSARGYDFSQNKPFEIR